MSACFNASSDLGTINTACEQTPLDKSIYM